jgi:hypothetical protein
MGFERRRLVGQGSEEKLLEMEKEYKAKCGGYFWVS